MKWKDFKSSIINLGFEEHTVFDEGERHLIEAANRALNFISGSVEKKTRVVHIDVPDIDGYYAVDLTDIVDFDSKSYVPPKIKGTPVGDYYYEEDVLFVQAPGEDVSVSYTAAAELIPYEVKDDYVIDIKKNLIPILELLTAYYIWLDDEREKAFTYYNQAQEKINFYLNDKLKNEKTSFTATVKGGVDFI